VRNKLLQGELRHELSGDGREQNAIAEVTGGDEVSGKMALAEKGQTIGCARTQARPGLMDASVGKFWNQSDSGAAKGFDGRRIDALVEASVFDSGADEHKTTGAWDKVDVVGVNDVRDQPVVAGNNAQHLSFERTSWQRERRNAARPGATAIDYG